jgi:hypothetical protein
MDSGKYQAIVAELKATWLKSVVKGAIQFFMLGGAIGGAILWAADNHFSTDEERKTLETQLSADIKGIEQTLKGSIRAAEFRRVNERIAELRLEEQFEVDVNALRLIRAKLKALEDQREDLQD